MKLNPGDVAATRVVVAIDELFAIDAEARERELDLEARQALRQEQAPALLEIIEQRVLRRLDHKNLNREVPVFADVVPTSENLGFEICRRLKRNWKQVFPGEWPKLETIRIGETARNIFEVRSDEIE